MFSRISSFRRQRFDSPVHRFLWLKPVEGHGDLRLTVITAEIRERIGATQPIHPFFASRCPILFHRGVRGSPESFIQLSPFDTARIVIWPVLSRTRLQLVPGQLPPYPAVDLLKHEQF